MCGSLRLLLIKLFRGFRQTGREGKEHVRGRKWAQRLAEMETNATQLVD